MGGVVGCVPPMNIRSHGFGSSATSCGLFKNWHNTTGQKKKRGDTPLCLELYAPVGIVFKLNPEVVLSIGRSNKYLMPFILFDEHKFIRIHQVSKAILCFFGLWSDKCLFHFSNGLDVPPSLHHRMDRSPVLVTILQLEQWH